MTKAERETRKLISQFPGIRVESRGKSGYVAVASNGQAFRLGQEPPCLVQEAIKKCDGLRVIVCGSREWTNREAIANRLFDLPTDTVIVHGCAKGADRIAGEEGAKLGLLADKHGIELELYCEGRP